MPQHLYADRSPVGARVSVVRLDLPAYPRIFLKALSLDSSMPRCSVTRRVHFNAAHRLHNPDRSDAWNKKTFGPCNHPNYHGHNYELELTVEGEIDPATGYVMDLNRLKALAQEHLLDHLDHKNLNLDVPWFRDLNPTSENIALVCWRSCGRAFPPISICAYGSGRRRGTMSTTKERKPDFRLGAPVTASSPPFADKVRDILAALGEDPGPGRTGQDPRASRSRRCGSSPRGTAMSVEEVVGDAVFEEQHQSMIMVRDIELYSLCEHHLLPFFGRAHVAYIPDGKILGLSKVARIVDVFARRLQVQERLTDQIADAVMDVLGPVGRRRRHRGRPFLHDDARCAEAELAHGHQRAPRHLPGRLEDAGGVSPTGARGQGDRVTPLGRAPRARDRCVTGDRRRGARRHSRGAGAGWCGSREA